MNSCNKCRDNPVIEPRYSGRSLCATCFIKLFEQRVRKTIRRNRFFNPGDKIAVALSGGKDSIVVLYLLKKLSKKFPDSRVFAITIDEGVRDRNFETAKSICNRLGVKHHIFSFQKELGVPLDEILEKSKNLENPAPPCSYCGVFRRYLLNKKARELGATKLATGHNLDDVVQTALMNFIRGDLKRFAWGISKDEKFVPRITPLRECPEEEVELYAQLVDLEVNPNPCIYSELSFRSIIGKIADSLEEKHPGTRFQILRSVDELGPIMRESYESDKNRIKRVNRCIICGELTSGNICKVCGLKEELGIK